MKRNEETEIGGNAHSFAQCFQIDVREITDPAIAHERLQSNNAAFLQSLELIEVSGNKSAPETEVDRAILARRCELLIKAWPVERRRMRIQRHLKYGRGAAART